jgi:hypothetical protein
MLSAVRIGQFAFAALLIAAVPAAGQGPSINGQLLREGVDTFNVSVAGDVFGRGTIARSLVANRQQLLQVHSWRIGGGMIVDSLFSDALSLRSIRQVRVVADTVIEITYSGDSAHVAKRPSANPDFRYSLALTTGVYSSAALDALVSGLPLSANFEAELRFFFAPPSDRGVEPVSVRVTGSETVATREAWVVSTTTLTGGSVYWIDKKTREVIQYDTREGPALIEFRR